MKPKFKPKFNHIGIVVKDIEKTMEMFSELFDVELPKTGPDSRIHEYPQGKYAMLKANGFWIELLEEKEGPMADFLKKNGDGAVAEICFVVDDIEKYYDKFKKMGLTPVDYFGEPLVDEKYFVIPVPGLPEGSVKCFYLPRKGNEPAFEILEEPPYPEDSEEELQKLTQQK